ncbi:MAG: hypothetical protein QNK05_00035 [Myxococcota bacterium]|nr:hypothetical protein [Myxococcota bacterium]
MPETGAPAHAGYSPEAYDGLIETFLAEGYRFLSYLEPPVPERCVYLRHDIDYSLSWAVELAERNRGLGVRGTFFLQLRSPLYNLLSFENLEAARRLLDAEQWLAFHVTLPEEPIDRGERAALILADYERTREALPELQPVFAWHNPSLRMTAEDLDEEVPGMVNAYGRIADTPVTYVGDSNLRHSVAELRDVARAGTSPLQLALAPMQWLPDRADMPGILARNLGRKLRDAEVEFRRNHVYRAHLPDGLPESVIETLERSVETAFRASGKKGS